MSVSVDQQFSCITYKEKCTVDKINRCSSIVIDIHRYICELLFSVFSLDLLMWFHIMFHNEALHQDISLYDFRICSSLLNGWWIFFLHLQSLFIIDTFSPDYLYKSSWSFWCQPHPFMHLLICPFTHLSIQMFIEQLLQWYFLR